MAAPLAVDLFCGLGGWTDGLLAEGYRVIGFDIERHRYPKIILPTETEDGLKQSGAALKLGTGRPKGAGFNVANEAAYGRALKQGFTEWIEYPGQLVIQDVLTLHGSQFRDADLIVASPPCQEYSYMAMPWTKAKAKAAAIRADASGAELERLNRLFAACFRIQREACAAAGRHIPMVVENVRGAQPWVGRARWSFGSFYLWGDVPALMPMTLKTAKVPGFRFDGNGGSFQSEGVKNTGGSWFNIAHNTTSGKGNNPDGRKAPAGTKWFNDGPRTPDSLASSGSKSPARKFASAMIAKIPLPLSLWIARAYLPTRSEAA